MAKDYSKEEVLGIIQKEAQERGIPRDDFLRFAYIETGGKFDEQASRGPNGAKGLFQFVPSTAAQYGIAGRELDAVVNTDAAARLYLDNKRDLTSHHNRTGQPYLSGQPQPNGLDMYMAHQQGSAGYHSIQAAINDGNFTRADTRPHLLNNVSSRDIQQVTGMSMEQFKQLPDKQMAETFVKYWDTKYRNISIPEVGVQPLGQGQNQGGQGQTPGGTGQSSKPAQNESNWPAPGNFKINDADKPGEGHGEFGTSRGGGTRTHKGVDIEGKVGDPIEAFRGGTVIAVKPNNGAAGNMVVIDHGNGLTSTYMHLNTIGVKEGQKVDPGDQIGTMGRTGNTPKQGDTHLHFEIRKNGEAVDPMPYLKGAKDLDTPSTKTELKHGDKGAQVEGLQTRLNDLGYTDAAGNKLKTDSDYGNRTKQAVEQFQRENGLNVTGVADKETMRLVDKGMTRHAAADGQLQPGEKGPDVRGFQTSLNELGYKGADGKPLKVDGEYGNNTKAAVSAFQKANGLPETGVADKATLDKVGESLTRKEQTERTVPERAPAHTAGHEQPVDRTPREPAAPAPQTPQINDPKHPDNKLYNQALSNLEQLGPNGGFKSREELERAAGALAADAKLSGLTQIDHVARSKNGEGLIAVQGADPWAEGAKRAFIDANQAANQPVDQSTKMADAKQTETHSPHHNPQRNEAVDSPVQKDDTQTQNRPRTVNV